MISGHRNIIAGLLLFFCWGIHWQAGYSQDCAETNPPPVTYFTKEDGQFQEVRKYLVPCSQMDSVRIEIPAWTSDAGSVPFSSPAVFVFMIRELPQTDRLTLEEFKQILFLDMTGQPMYFEASTTIDIDVIKSALNLRGRNALLPVLVHHSDGHSMSTMFESDCITFFPDQALKILWSPNQSGRFSRFDEIEFAQWPEDTSILDFFDFSFEDQTTGEPITATAIDNRTLKLDLPDKEGVLKYNLDWKDYPCTDIEIGKHWTFPEPEIRIDTVTGFRNVSTCIPVRAKNFLSVSGFTLPFRWHRDSLIFSGINRIHPDLKPYIQVTEEEISGDYAGIRVIFPAGSDTLDLPDSTILFEWCGKTLIDAGESVSLHPDAPLSGEGPEILIYNIAADSHLSGGGIDILEDREIPFEWEQLCMNRAGEHRIALSAGDSDGYPYSYTLLPAGMTDSVFHPSEFIIPGLEAGEYELTIRDSFGFERTETVVVSKKAPVPFTLEIIDIENPDCLNPEGGRMTGKITPGGDYQMDFMNRPDHFFDGETADGLPAGRFIVRAEDEDGCTDTVSVTLDPPREIQISWNPADLVFCPETDAVRFEIEDISDVPDPTLEFQLDGGEVRRPGDSLFLSSAQPTGLTAWNGDGCTLDTIVVSETAPQQWTVFDTAYMDLPIGEEVVFDAAQRIDPSESRWEYGDRFVSNEEELRFTPDRSGTLYFQGTLYGKCIYSDSIEIRLLDFNKKPSDDAFPNAFSPNGDGENDYFILYPTPEMKEISGVMIYDRYGNFIFEENYRSQEDPGGWDGLIGHQAAEPGVYLVVVDYVLQNGEKQQTTFDLLLIR